MNEPVLDASAVLALLNREDGFEAVAAVLPAAVLSAVNYAEVISKLRERGVPTEAVVEAVRSLGVEIVPFTEEQALQAGDLRPLTKPLGLSLGDRACLALARTRACAAMTAERAWDDRLSAATGVEIVRIRGSFPA